MDNQTQTRTAGGDASITRFHVDIPSVALTDLRSRLTTARLPGKQTVDDWSQGAPLGNIEALLNRWRSGYDMHRLARRLNALPQFRTKIDGQHFHFLHIRSKHERAMPLILTHGWPGSVIEFLDVIGPLTDPVARWSRG